MRWSCPHCGVNLAVSDDKLGNGWSFSRCYKCGGFALIRRAEVNLVKVDRAPAGEHILLPEATEEPDQMLGHEATQNLARYRKESEEKAAIRQAARVLQQQQQAAQTAAEAAQSLAGAMNAGTTNAAANPKLPPRVPQPPVFRQNAPEIPPPLAPLKESNRRAQARVLPVAIGIALISAAGSGIYLFQQGQTLWEKARINATEENSDEATIRPAAAHRRAHGVPGAISDQVHQNAMAPLRTNDVPALPASAAAQIQDTDLAPSTSQPGEASKSIQIDAKNSVQAEHSQITLASNTLPAANGVLVVKLKGNSGKLYAGPGSLYPIVGTAEAARPYAVMDWNDRWFRVVVDEEPGKAPVTAWIRTDLVRVVPSTGQERLPSYP